MVDLYKGKFQLAELEIEEIKADILEFKKNETRDIMR